MHWSRELLALTAGVRWHIAGPIVIGLHSCLPKPPLPRSASRTTLEAALSPLLRGMSNCGEIGRYGTDESRYAE